MPLPYKNAVCKGSIFLGSGCNHCERCAEEREKMLQARDAEKSDVYQATELSSWKATEGATEMQGSEIITDGSIKLTAANLGTIESQKAPSPIAGHSGLPVAGYAKTVEQWKIDMVNENKILEEKVLRRVDEHVRPRGDDSIDGASVQLARRHVEDAFYRLNRAIMQPKRIKGDL